MRPYQSADLAEWIRMRCALWPDSASTPSEAMVDAQRWLATPGTAVFIAASGGDFPHRLLAFAEAGERRYADGCDTAPVAYLEGWWVEPAHRRMGLGKALIEAVAGWAQQCGYQELASDSEFGNEPAHHAHERAGFEEVGRAVLYRRTL